MVNHSFRKTRPSDRAARKRAKRGIFACQICGQRTTSNSGVVDAHTGLAVCDRCVAITAETAVAYG